MKKTVSELALEVERKDRALAWVQRALLLLLTLGALGLSTTVARENHRVTAILALVVTFMGLWLWALSMLYSNMALKLCALIREEQNEGGNPTPEYSFCEFTSATSTSSWHIRRVTSEGLKFGGGIKSPSLCGRTDMGWDLPTPMSIDAVVRSHVCDSCRTKYMREEAMKPFR